MYFFEIRQKCGAEHQHFIHESENIMLFRGSVPLMRLRLTAFPRPCRLTLALARTSTGLQVRALPHRWRDHRLIAVLKAKHTGSGKQDTHELSCNLLLSGWFSVIPSNVEVPIFSFLFSLSRFPCLTCRLHCSAGRFEIHNLSKLLCSHPSMGLRWARAQ